MSQHDWLIFVSLAIKICMHWYDKNRFLL